MCEILQTVQVIITYCLLKYILPLHHIILCFKFLYLLIMQARLPATIFVKFIPLWYIILKLGYVLSLTTNFINPISTRYMYRPL